MTNIFQTSATNLGEVNVVVSDTSLPDDVTIADLEDEAFTDFGSYKGPVNEGDTIKINPGENLPGRYVTVFLPKEDSQLLLKDVKVFVTEPEEPAGPGEPGGPGGSEGPKGPEGPGGPEGPEEAGPEGPGESSGGNPTDATDDDDETCFKSDESAAPWLTIDIGELREVIAVRMKPCPEDRK